MGLTVLFREYGVSFQDEPYRTLIHTDVYDIRSLHRMGYHLVRGQWTRRISGQAEDRADIDEDIAEEEWILSGEAGPSETQPETAAQPAQSDPSTSAQP